MNLRFLARQLTNVVVTTAGHINDDRVFFGMQLARRLPCPASQKGQKAAQKVGDKYKK